MRSNQAPIGSISLQLANPFTRSVPSWVLRFLLAPHLPILKLASRLETNHTSIILQAGNDIRRNSVICQSYMLLELFLSSWRNVSFQPKEFYWELSLSFDPQMKTPESLGLAFVARIKLAYSYNGLKSLKTTWYQSPLVLSSSQEYFARPILMRLLSQVSNFNTYPNRIPNHKHKN